MTKIKSGIKVSAPATISNLGSGIGSMALALRALSDEIIVNQIDQAGVHLQQITGDKKQLSLKLEENTAGLAALRTWEHLVKKKLIDPNIGIGLELRKKVPIGSGLGSSAASAVAGAMAINEFFARPLEQKALLPFAAEAEKLTSPHANLASVGAALWGGWVLMRDHQSLDLHRLPLLRGLHIAVICPHKTVLSKAVLAACEQEKISFNAAKQQAANTAALILGLYNSNFSLIQNAMQDEFKLDILTKEVPFFDQLQDLAMQAGALAANVSGTGPAFFAFCNNSLKAEKALEQMQNLYNQHKTKYSTFISKIDFEGAKIQ
jgi:homoserine kinase